MRGFRPTYKKVILNGIKFDSEDEARFYQELEEEAKKGNILYLEIHKPFSLIEPFVKKNGKHSNGLTYEADFVFFDKRVNKWRVVDIKGFEEEHFKIKKKIFECMYCTDEFARFEELEVLTYRKTLNGFVSTAEVKRLMKTKKQQLVAEKNYYKNIVLKQEHDKELAEKKKQRELKRLEELLSLPKLTKAQQTRLDELKAKYDQ